MTRTLSRTKAVQQSSLIIIYLNINPLHTQNTAVSETEECPWTRHVSPLNGAGDLVCSAQA